MEKYVCMLENFTVALSIEVLLKSSSHEREFYANQFLTKFYIYLKSKHPI